MPTVQERRQGYVQHTKNMPRVTSEDQLAFDTIEQRYEPHNATRADLERRWSINKAFGEGYQWIDWDANQWKVVNRNVGRRKILETRNFMRGIRERQIAALTGFTPEFKGRPETRDHEDQQAAEIASRVANHYYFQGRLPTVLQELAGWAWDTGHSFLGVEWDPQAGGKFQDVVEGPDGQLSMKEYALGDIYTYCASPYEIHVDPNAVHDDHVRWMMEVTKRPMQWIHDHHPDLAAYVQSDIDGTDRFSQYDRYSETIRHNRINSLSQDWVLYFRMFEKPSQMYPNGRMIIRAGGIILKNTDNPMPGGGFPWIPYRKTVLSGSYWGGTECTDMVTPQQNVNRLASRQIEHTMLLGMSTKLLVNSMPDAQYNNAIGNILKWKGANEPKYLQPPSLPSDSYQQFQQAVNDLQQISGIQGAEQGIYQGKISGDAYSFLIEQSMQQRAPGLLRMRDVLNQWGTKTCQLFQKYASEERKISVTGRDESISLHAFSGANLQNNTDIRVTNESMIPRSQTMATNQVAAWYQAGMFQPDNPVDKKVAWRIVGVEDPSVGIEAKNSDWEKAERENDMARQGHEIPNHQPFMDLDAHVEAHRLRLNSEEFEAWDPRAQKILLGHFEQTLMMAIPKPGATLPPEQSAEIGPQGQQAPA